MVISKVWWIVGFFFTVYIIQNQMPTPRQFILGSIYTILTLPLNYWLTYGFSEEKKHDRPKGLVLGKNKWMD